MKHTPGPWVVCGATLIWSPSAKKVVAGASMCKPASGLVEYEAPRLAELDEPAANARLIAAAPDLLHALICITDQLERIGDGRKDAEFIEAARAVIAKAIGQ